jgi:hypothetical protein
MALFTTGFPAALDSTATLGDSTNLATTTLDGAHNDSITTLTVASTTLFPSVGAIVVGSEVIFYTGKTGTTFTGCTRGADGSTAAAHSDEDDVNGYIAAAFQHVIRAAIIAAQTKLGTGASVPTTTGHVLAVTGAGATAFQSAPLATPKTCRLHCSSMSDVPTTTWTPIPFNVEVEDADGMHEGVTHPDRITVPTARFILGGSALWDNSGTTGTRGFRILDKDSNILCYFEVPAAAYCGVSLITDPIDCTSGDWFVFQCFQSSGTDQGLLLEPKVPKFWALQVGP